MTRVLLLGPSSHSLASRLGASGYESFCLSLEDLALPQQRALLVAAPPAVVVLAAESRSAIAVLRQDLPGVPLLLDIGSDGVDARSSCLSAGADDFWLSDAPPSDLLLRLRLHTRVMDRQSGRSPLLRLADLSIDPGNRTVWRGQRQVALTAREYGLLLHLLEHRGQILSREQILAAAWKGQQGVASNVVEVYVRYLRQKLEEGGERRLLHTVRGRGYSLSDGLPDLEGPSQNPPEA
ncbi:MAG: winged-helix domain-containing protein [Prochlorococcaceae cyanobacterium]